MKTSWSQLLKICYFLHISVVFLSISSVSAQKRILLNKNGKQAEPELPKIVTPGVYFEKEEAELYDQVGALVFNFERPKWFNKFKLRMGYPCTSDNSTESSLCPVFYHIYRTLLSKFDNSMDINSLKLNVDEFSAPIQFNCDLVKSHFQSVTLNNYELDGYLSQLAVCLQKKFWASKLLSDYSKDFLPSYDNMMARFMDEYNEKMNPVENIRVQKEKEGSEINYRTAMTTLILTHFLTLGQRWVHGFSSCKNKFIPETLVTPKQLKTGLQQLMFQIGKTDDGKVGQLEEVIPFLKGALSRYYKEKLADCILTEDRLVVRVLVPLKKKARFPEQMLTIKSIPFLYKVNEWVKQLCMIQGFEEGMKFSSGVHVVSGKPYGQSATFNGDFNATKQLVSYGMPMDCDQTNFRLCKVPSHLDSIASAETACARALMLHHFLPSEYNGKKVMDVCRLECTDVDDVTLPMVFRAQDEFKTLYIVGTEKHDYSLECKDAIVYEANKNLKLQKLTPPSSGVLAIIVPCTCTLTRLGITYAADANSCTMDLFVTQMEPIHWYYDKVGKT